MKTVKQSKWWRKLTLRRKFLISYGILFLSFIFIILLFFQKSLENNMQFYETFLTQSNREISSSLDVIFSNTSRIAKVHYFDSSVRALLQDNSVKSSSTRVAYQEKMIRFINTAILGNRFIVRGTFISPSGDSYSNISTQSDSYNQMLIDTANEQGLDDPEEVYYTDIYDCTINMARYRTITVIRRIYYGRSYLGIVGIDLDYDRICTQLNSSYSDSTLGVVMLFNGGSIIYSSQISEGLDPHSISEEDRKALIALTQQEELPQNAVCSLNGQDYLIAMERNQETGWIIMQAIPTQSFQSLSMQNITIILLYSLLLFLALAFFSLYFLRRTTQPLVLLDKAITETETEPVPMLDVPVRARSNDEISHLVTHYNEMAQRINEDIQKNYINELNRRQMQLKMLQFQINPHFIYNTLNIISSIAELNEVPEIVAVSTSLSEVLRYNVKGSDIVTVAEEIAQVKNYMQILFVRFPNRFLIDYDISQEAADCTMLKFLLQPLVENSIQHAFTALRPHDRLKISAFVSGEDLYLSLWDDGCGMIEEQVQNLNTALHTENALETDASQVGIGLRNVNDRIRSYYGRSYGITVESSYGVYTRIEIHLSRNAALSESSRSSTAKEEPLS